MLGHVRFFVISWTTARQASLFIPNFQSLLKLMSIESMMPSNNHPLSSPSSPALNISQHQGLFKLVNSLHQVAKVWSLRFSLSPSKEYSGLISFRTEWFGFCAAQGTLKNLLQHHSLKASIPNICVSFAVSHTGLSLPSF